MDGELGAHAFCVNTNSGMHCEETESLSALVFLVLSSCLDDSCLQ